MVLVLSAIFAAAPNVGERVPDFTVKDTEGRALHLAQLVESGNVVVAFFPKAFTSG